MADEKMKRLADNALLTVVARSALLLMLPTLIWIGSTLVELKVQMAAQSVHINDHGRRLGSLESWRDRGWSPTPNRSAHP